MELTTLDALQPHDALSTFVKRYFAVRPHFLVPVDGVVCLDGLYGVVLYRHEQFQVQHLICRPHLEIPDHLHPNVDSYEIGLCGMEFRHSGKVVLPFSMDRVLQDEAHGLSASLFRCIRVQPQDWHGGRAGPQGGTFLSIQHWLNGVPPSDVGRDWQGENLGLAHAENIQTTEAVC